MPQPAAPAVPTAPAATSAPSAEVGDLATRVDNMTRALEEADRRANARAATATQRGQAAAQGGNASVIKDAGGRIVVTGPDGRTITIDPKAGLDEDQVQNVVQTALQPVSLARSGADTSHKDVQIVAIVFTFLFLIAVVITRAIRHRPLPAHATTAVLPPETVARLARIEQAVEAVAIEVERISEAQRYSAQLLTDRLGSAPALGMRTADAPAARG